MEDIFEYFKNLCWNIPTCHRVENVSIGKQRQYCKDRAVI